MPAGATIGAAVIGGGAQILSGNKAAKAQQKAANLTIAEERRQYDQTRADFAPWRETGVSALGKLAGMYGVGASGAPSGTADPNAAAYGGFFTSPGYEFRRDEGNKAIERSAASRGLLRSGAAVKAIDRYTQGLASSEFNSFADRLASLAGVGQSATGATAAAGQAATQGIAGAYGMAGNARASSYLNTGSAVNTGINNALQAYLWQQGNKAGASKGG
jgi:hypothetical protein